MKQELQKGRSPVMQAHAPSNCWVGGLVGFFCSVSKYGWTPKKYERPWPIEMKIITPSGESQGPKRSLQCLAASQVLYGRENSDGCRNCQCSGRRR